MLPRAAALLSPTLPPPRRLPLPSGDSSHRTWALLFPTGVFAQDYSLPEGPVCLVILGAAAAEGSPPNHDRIIKLDSPSFLSASSPKQVALEIKLKY